MHLFTGIQLVCLCILWSIKSSSFSLLFPFFLIMMIPVRSQLCDKIFTTKELRAVSVNGLIFTFYFENVIILDLFFFNYSWTVMSQQTWLMTKMNPTFMLNLDYRDNNLLTVKTQFSSFFNFFFYLVFY